MSEETAYATFKSIRFADNGGEPRCPYCACEACDTYKVKRLFKCKECHRQFSATNGTALHGRKMSYRDLLTAIALFVNGVNGNAALRLSRDLGCSYKTAFVLAKKLSRAMGAMQRENVLTGDVDVDGLFTGGYIRPANLIADRRSDGRKEFNGKRRSIVTMRERRIGGRSRAVVVPNEKAAVAIIQKVVHPSAHVFTDEGGAFSRFYRDFEKHSTVNHSVGMVVNGITINAVESQHSRIRRGERGVYLKISGSHAQRFADEFSWRDDFRRVSNGQQFTKLLGATLGIGRDHELAGYWQRRPDWYRKMIRQRALKALTKRRRGWKQAPISYTAPASG